MKKSTAKPAPLQIQKMVNGIFLGLIALVLMGGGAYIDDANEKTAQEPVDPFVQELLDEYDAALTAAALEALAEMKTQ